MQTMNCFFILLAKKFEILFETKNGSGITGFHLSKLRERFFKGEEIFFQCRILKLIQLFAHFQKASLHEAENALARQRQTIAKNFFINSGMSVFVAAHPTANVDRSKLS